MSKYRLIVSFELEDEEDNIEALKEEAEVLLYEMLGDKTYWVKKGTVSLIKENDRSGKNLLSCDKKQVSKIPLRDVVEIS